MATTVFERRRPPASVVQHALADTRQSVFWLDDLAAHGGRPSRRVLSAQPRRRPRHRRRRLHGPVDRGARQAAQPGCARHAGRGEADRLGGVRAQRRVLRGEPHPRRARTAAPAGPTSSTRSTGSGSRTSTTSRRPSAELGMDRSSSSATARSTSRSSRTSSSGSRSRWPTRPHAATTRCVPRRGGGAGRGRTRPPTSARVWNKRTSALLHPAKLASELARVAEELGVEIFERSPVRRPRDTRIDGRRSVVTDRRPIDAATRRARHERVPVAAQAQPAHDGAGLRLRAHDRTPHRRAARVDRLAATGRASATWPTSSTTTG